MGKAKKRKLHAASATKKTSNSGPSKPPKAAPKKAIKPTIPFHPSDGRILLVGEGDFSFARSVVEHHGACDITATCYDSQATLYEKYTPQAGPNVQYLEEQGQIVLYSIDATKLATSLKGKGRFDRILFNFPHVGGKSKDVNRQVRFNQELLVKFFSEASNLLAGPEATIIVTLFEGEPYTLWNIRDLARHCDLEMQRSFKFMGEAYPGYSHARTLGNIEGGGGWKGEEREARTYVFQRKAKEEGTKIKDMRQQRMAGASAGVRVRGEGKRKRGGGSSESESEDG